MATGDSLLLLGPSNGTPPATLYATFGVMDGASTPAEAILILKYDDTTQKYIDFYCVMPEHYDGGGITLTVMFSANDVASDVIEWQAAFRRIADDSEDLDSTAHTYVYNAVVATVPSVIGEVAYDNITFTNGAEMDSVVAGDYFILRVTRDPTPSSGTNAAGNGEIHILHMKET